MTICFFEDEAYSRFLPLSYLRPVYMLRAGITELFRRHQRLFPDATAVLACRDQLAPLVGQAHSEHPVNIIKRDDSDVLFINGRLRDPGDLKPMVEKARLSTVFLGADNETVGVLFRSDITGSVPQIATPHEYHRLYDQQDGMVTTMRTGATLYGHSWDLVADIEASVNSDFEAIEPASGGPRNVRVYDGAYLVNEDDVFLGDDVTVLPGAVIDASHGPVYIGANSRIEPHAAIYGPSYIGPNTVILAGKIIASSIGHTCRVGGEVEESVFHAYVNKYHAGFIGHSYVAPWVNFGAMTTNSDLKNNYSNVSVSIDGRTIDTGMNKVGSVIGDHTKFGIGTLLTTGITIGLCCNIFGGGLVSDREVPSFSWGTSGQFVAYRMDKALETARRVAERRHCRLSAAEESLLQTVHDRKTSADGCLTFGGGQ